MAFNTEIRPCKNGTLDEVVGTGDFHLEKIDNSTFWARLYTKDGKDVVIWLRAIKGKIVASAEFESR